MPAIPDPRIEQLLWRLVERGSAYDLSVLEETYDHDAYHLFVAQDGEVSRVSRAETIAKFEARKRAGQAPLSTEAQLLHVEQQADTALVLVRRRMHPTGPASLYELRLRPSTAGGWKVSGETVTPWPATS